MVHIGQAARFGIFLKSASRWVPDGWVEIRTSGGRCHFWAFQLELDILDTGNIGNGPVGTKLQPLELGRISEISDNSSSARHTDDIDKLYERFVFIHVLTLKKSVNLICVFYFTHQNASYGLYI